MSIEQGSQNIFARTKENMIFQSGALIIFGIHEYVMVFICVEWNSFIHEHEKLPFPKKIYCDMPESGKF